MAYDEKAHRHEHQVKVRLDDEDFDRLRAISHKLKLQHSVLSREILKAVIEVIEQTGELPDWLEKKRA
ncbi:hypothetical protein [Pseudomonas sp. Marseille-Q5115]|uniref:hypothetical protein n=1 Tax=Pseudomonas sp. Marseille-Q5115 TaxID=2866593 RepID=UPI001CE4A54E|nr:hypothetical protein [Pseudomonas sp. Marseille-Q5115]